jgi:hypothetical protein
VGVGLKHVISLAPDEHLHSQEAWILAGAATLAMTSLAVIALTSMKKPAARSKGIQDYIPFALAAVPLAAAAVATSIPPFVFAIVLTVVCGLQVIFAQTIRKQQLA